MRLSHILFLKFVGGLPNAREILASKVAEAPLESQMESLIDIGVNCSLLNHSERRMAKSDIIKIIEKSKKA